MSEAIIALNNISANETVKKVRVMTETLIEETNKIFSEASTEIAKEAKKGIISLEAIQRSNENLITTIKQVSEIKERGLKARADAENELARIEQELQNTLYQTR